MLTIGVCCSALLGLLLGSLVPARPVWLLASLALAGPAALLARRHPPWLYLALACSALLLGALRGSLLAAAAEPDPLAGYVGLPVALRGRVTAPASIGLRSSRVVLAVEAVAPAGQPPRQPSRAHVAVVDASASSDGSDTALATVEPGDVLEVEGTLSAPIEPVGRAPPTILFPRRVSIQAAATQPNSSPPELAARLRTAAERAIRSHLPAPQGALAAGVLLGGSAGLDPSLRRALERSGLAHLLAVDGYKQVLVVAVLRALAAPWLGARKTSLLVLPGVVAYTLLAGARPSAVRAGLMVGLAELAGAMGRLADPLTSVLVAATLMAGLEPGVLVDPAFQLSLAATLGLILLWPRLRRRLRGLPRPIAEPAGLTLVVTLATLPVTLSVFQSVSLVSPLAHIVAVPLVAPVLLSASLLALAGSLAPGTGLAIAAGWLAWLPSTLLLHIVSWFGSLPGAALATGHLGLPAALALAASLLVWGVWAQPEAAGLRAAWARLDARHSSSLQRAILVLGMSLLGLGSILLVRPDGRLHVQFLAVGSGDAVLVRGPTGQTALVVAGRPDAAALARALGSALPLWEHGVDTLLVLDTQAAQRLDLLLQRYTAAQRLEPAADVASRLDLGGGAALDVEPRGAGPADVSVSMGTLRLALLGHPTGAVPPEAVDD